MGSRFINAGVAEQNMISVAAGLARSGLKPWTYSIAPFIYARPFEQIRNDACLHNLPVRLIGNGGGYGYGVMGATHHALEDYGSLLTLPHMHAFVPAFGPDVAAAVRKLGSFDHPAYLRLGLAEEPKDLKLPPYAQWRRVIEGDGPTIVGIGPVISPIIAAVQDWEISKRPNIWVVTELPLTELPAAFLDDVKRSHHLAVIEEHVAQGGLGQMLSLALMSRGLSPARFSHRCAIGYPSARYGSQKFHRRESGLDAESIVNTVLKP
jgi:transketolase